MTDSAAATDSWWEDLAVTALLGTDRRGADLPALLPGLPGPLGEAAGRLSGDPAAVLLEASALATAYRRGGVLPTSLAEAPSVAPPESLAGVTPRAAEQLAGLLAEGDLDLVLFWCATAAQFGKVAPERVLPVLLDLAVKQPMLRAAVGSVLGERGRWLAELNPAWASLFSPEPPADPGVWQFGGSIQRLAWLRAERRRDPEAALAALTGTWASEPGAARADLLGALVTGLGPADEALLETALDDRRQDVRARAAELLTALPSSAYADRMRSRAMGFVRSERFRLRTRFVISLPAGGLDDEAARDGITDLRATAGTTWEARRQWWLEQIVAATPLSAWEQLFGSPENAVGAKFEGDDTFGSTLRAGWAWAAVRQGDRAWALALLSARVRHRVEELLPLLDGDDLSTALRALIGTLGAGEIQLVTGYLAACPTPWPAAVADDALTWLTARSEKLDPRQARLLLTTISYRLPVDAAPAVHSLAQARPLEDPWRPALGAVERVLSIRLRVHEELQ